MSTRCVLTEQEWRDKVTEGLLPAQQAFIDDTEHLILGFCAGFGAGKTRALAAKACVMCIDNPGTIIAVFEPTFITGNLA